MHPSVILVRPWTDAQTGGCCSGDAHGCTEPAHRPPPSAAAAAVGAVYRLLRAELPDVDVQIVGPQNTAYLLPTVYRAVRRRAGMRRALRAAVEATTAGAVLVDGDQVGDMFRLGADGTLAAVRDRLPVRAS